MNIDEVIGTLPRLRFGERYLAYCLIITLIHRHIISLAYWHIGKLLY